MSTELREVLRTRAERADAEAPTDPHAFVAVVRERAEQRRRTRRNVVGAAGGAGLVAALIAGVLVLPSSGRHSGGAPAGNPGGTSVARTADPAVRADRVARAAAVSRAAASARRSAAAAASARRSTAASAAAAAESRARAASARGLDSVPTPEAAAVAIGLVPEGWKYVGRQGPTTFYGPAGTTPSNTPDFGKVIVVDVHERFDQDGPNDLMIGGRAGRYGTDAGVTVVSVIVDPTTELDIQLPVSAPVTRAQALQIAATLDLRSAAEKTHG